MNSRIEIVEEESQYTLEISKKIPVWRLPAVIGQSYKSILDYMNEKKIKPAGMPYVRYLNLSWDILDKTKPLSRLFSTFLKKWEMRIGFPVQGHVDGSGQIHSGIRKGGKYVRVLHRGPYDEMEKTYRELLEWAKANKPNLMNECIEEYLNDPRQVKKEELETVILVPLSDT